MARIHWLKHWEDSTKRSDSHEVMGRSLFESNESGLLGRMGPAGLLLDPWQAISQDPWQASVKD